MGKAQETIVEVFPKFPLPHQGRQARIGSGNYTRVHAHHVAAAEPLQFLLFQKAQELRLKTEGHVADLVEKERASLSGLDSAGI